MDYKRYKNKGINSFPKWVIVSFTIFGSLFIAGFLVLFLVWAGMFGSIPGNDELKTIHQQEASQILSADGAQLGTYHQQNRTTINLDETSPELVDALLAIEDIRFYSHNGIDYRALGRVFIKSILMGQNAGGGSTITQQLAKNLYPRSERRGVFLITDKLREMMIARKIESIYSKDEILELYLNTVSFGENTFGIEMASYRFFNKPPDELNLNESATLAGLLKATTYYNPHRNPDRSLQRRNVVLRQMERYEFISPEVTGETVTEPLKVNYNRSAFSDNLAPYFRKYLQNEVQSLLTDVNSSEDKTYNLRTDGLTIHTTLDSRLQVAAENAVHSHMKQLQAIFDNEHSINSIFGEDDPDVLWVWERSEQFKMLEQEGLSSQEIEEILYTPAKTILFSWDGYERKMISPYDEIRYYLSFLNAGFFAIHPTTGHVLAWVGGIDHRHFQYDQVLARRQTGSAFKPVLYAAALEAGRRPCDYQRNMLAQFSEYDDWTPQNINEEYGGRYSLQAAFAQSVNTVAVHLATETGSNQIRETAGNMGITSHLPEGPAVALGTAEMSLLELTTAYTTFLNEGKPATPQFITHIYDNEGELIYDARENKVSEPRFGYPVSENSNPLITPSQIDNRISGQTAATLTKMLEKAVNDGTGNPLRSQYNIQHALGGKTGTTQNYTDGWFVGFTPNIVFGTRVGGWNNRVRFKEFPAYASQTALPIVGEFLQNIADNSSLNPQPNKFPASQTDTPFNMQCEDHRNDRVIDRVKDFFTGKSSDEPRIIGESEEEEKGGNIFKRIGRKLGL
ncbi:MAG: transglycosylase domain-containing protein [Balneolaceae bacterium]